MVGHHLATVVARDAIAEQFAEVVAKHRRVASQAKRGYRGEVRLALALLTLLVAPAVALAREPVISYVDESGTFRLYDEELEADVEPPPPVPTSPGFRYGMSLNGRYIVFTDAGKKLHLLDRATNTQLPLPGIDVYDNPQSLSVSDTGLIAFDKTGAEMGVVYNSATQSFVDTGLGVDNGHRQTRLSGDGRFLGTTCLNNCIVDFADDGGARPYLQDLASKTDTGFPNDANADEEHPCIDGDGSIFGFDKRRSAAVMEKDIFLFDRSVSPPQPIALSAANDPAKDDTNCVLDAAGEFVGLTYDQATFLVYHRTTATFLNLPSDRAFRSTSLFSAPYSPPPPPGNGGPVTTPPPDVTKPGITRFRMTRRRFRPRRRATAFRFVLSEVADVRIAIRRRGRLRGVIRREDLAAGRQRIFFSGRLRGRRLRPGRYVAVLIARDAAGNVSDPVRIRFRVLAPAGDRGS
jgi:hypothetical protein